jgi:hypothetical protein
MHTSLKIYISYIFTVHYRHYYHTYTKRKGHKILLCGLYKYMHIREIASFLAIMMRGE